MTTTPLVRSKPTVRTLPSGAMPNSRTNAMTLASSSRSFMRRQTSWACPCSPASLGFQEVMHLTDRDRALADGGGDALDRTTAHVAHGEHALAAGLEQGVGAVGRGPGEDEPLLVQWDLSL